MTRAWSCRQEEAAGKEIHMCTAKHLALQHLQTIDLAFNRSLAPRQRHRRLDGGYVCVEPFGKAPEGREGARGGAYQPWFELGRLTLADQAGKVLRQRHGLCEHQRRLGELRQLLVVLRRAPVWRAEGQPRCAPGGEWAV
jgi:hypothetical protein